MTRNVFDQYKYPENRLTHALFASLDSDRRLLRRFLFEVVGCSRPIPRDLRIEEQRLPGEPPASEEEAERRGLPDAWIHDEESWSVLVESKINSPILIDQLRRHVATAEKRGFQVVRLLVIGLGESRSKLPKNVRFTTWTRIYAWLRKQERAEWAARAAEYMEVAETRMVDTGYLRQGTLTEFTGFSFGRDDEYNYPEAKRQLVLAMNELRKNRQLVRKLEADLAGAGRPAITGRTADIVWDFIPLRGSGKSAPFTKFPHLTLSVQRELVHAHVTFPHGMRSEFRRNLVSLGEDGFHNAVLMVERNLRGVLRGIPDAAPWFVAIQRRYRTQRSPATIDARLEFDLRTALNRSARQGSSRVKPQSQWVRLAFDVMVHRRSNYQTAIGAIFPYRQNSKIGKAAALDLIAATWIACRPVLKVALGHSWLRRS